MIRQLNIHQGYWASGLFCALAVGISWQSLAATPVPQRLLGQEQKQPPSRSQSTVEAQVISPEREQEVLEFVGQHQPKLRELIEFLRERQPAQFQQALKEMSRSKQRLSSLEKRDQELYQVELELWQTRSQLRLLAAEISVASGGRRDNLEKQLENLALKEVTTELKRLRLQRDRTAKQLEQIDQQIAERASGQEAQLAKIVKQWKGRIAKQSPPQSK